MQIGSKKWKNLIDNGAKELDVKIDQVKKDQFVIHALELVKWNQKINLTAITDPFEIAVKHFLDSIAPAPVIPPDASLLDIGSGGGFPGIPLKVLMPSLSVTLIDASRKKVNFLKHVIRTLKLENIEALDVRAEDLARDRTFANNFDVIISRALSSMDTFVLMALPLLSKDGIIIVMKGKTSKEEIESEYSLIKKMSGISEGNENNITLNSIKYTLPYLHSERSVLIFKSIR